MFREKRSPPSSSDGGGCGKLVEQQGLTANEVFSMVWSVQRVDRDEVLSMSASGISRNLIALHFGCARATISKILQSVEIKY